MEAAPELRRYARHYEEAVTIPAVPADVFALLDDHASFGSHMAEPSWRTLWSTMRLEMDDKEGRSVGSRIRMEGQVLGVRLHLDEDVTRREPPSLKEWETIDEPKLLVVGRYRMRVQVEPAAAGSHVRVMIDYDLPERRAWLGRLLGAAYARWCVREMTRTLETRVVETRAAVAGAPAQKHA